MPGRPQFNPPKKSEESNPSEQTINAFLTRLISFSVLPLILLTLVLAVLHANTIQKLNIKKAENQLQNVKVAIDRDLQLRISALQMLADSPFLDESFQLEEFYKVALNFRNSFSGHVILADLSTQMLLNTREPLGSKLPILPVPKGFAAAPYVMENLKPAVGDMFMGPIANKNLVAVVVPVLRHGKLKALLLSIIDASHYQQVLDEMAISRGYSMTIFDSKKAIIAHHTAQPTSSGSLLGSGCRRFTFESQIAHWTVVLEVSNTIFYTPLILDAVILALAIFIALISSIFGGKILSGELIQSVKSLTDASGSITPKQRISEIEEVRIVLKAAQERASLSGEEIIRSEALYRSLFEAANVGKSITLPTGEVNVNKAFADMLGYSQEAMRHKTWQQITPQEQIDSIQKIITPLLNGEKDSAQFTKQYIHKNGHYIWADVNTVVQRDTAGIPLYYITTVIDITRQKQATELLRISEQRFHNAFQSCPAGMVITRISDGKFVDANESFLRMFEFDREEVIGHTSTELGMWAPKERKEVVEKQKEVGGLKNCELRARSKSGREITIFFSSNPLDLEGEPHHITTMIDITEKNKVQKDLIESEKRYRALFENMAAGFVLFEVLQDDDGSPVDLKILAANNIFKTTTGLLTQDVIGRRLTQVLPGIDEDDTDWIGIYSQIAMTGESRQFEQNSEKLGCYYSIIAYRAGPKQCAVTFVDVTEHKKAEEERQKFVMLAESSSEFIGMCDLNFNPIYVNPAGIRMVGLPDMAAACQVRVQDYFFPEDQRFITEEFFPRVLREGGGDVEIRLCHFQTGEPIWMFYYLFSLCDASGEVVGWATVSRNITDRKRAAEEKEKLQVQLQQAQKMESVGRLAGGVAHDFNNMLSIILGYTEMALENIDATQPFYDDLKEVHKAAERSAGLTRQLLAFARKQIAEPKVLELNEIVGEMLKMLRRLIGEDIDLEWIPGAELGLVMIDPAQVDQILANLCVNARDAISGVGKVTIETCNASFDEEYCVEHPDFLPGAYVMLAVSDDGIGMDKETAANIFEPFFSTKAPGKGTGLGLSTVYGIAKQNNGFINIYSEPGKGTTFKIYFQRYETETEVYQIKTDTYLPAGGNETVLFVEDEAMIMQLGIRMLENLGYQVLPANTPRKAIQLSREYSGTIDLLITDVVMPEMNGKELAEQLKNDRPELKILFMSGYTANVIAHHGILDEGLNFLPKPFSNRELALRIRKALTN